jgi:hypothetical protein
MSNQEEQVQEVQGPTHKWIVVNDLNRELSPIGYGFQSPIYRPSLFPVDIIGQLLNVSKVTAMFEVYEQDHTLQVPLNNANFRKPFDVIWAEVNPETPFPWTNTVETVAAPAASTPVPADIEQTEVIGSVTLTGKVDLPAGTTVGGEEIVTAKTDADPAAEVVEGSEAAITETGTTEGASEQTDASASETVTEQTDAPAAAEVVEGGETVVKETAEKVADVAPATTETTQPAAGNKQQKAQQQRR